MKLAFACVVALGATCVAAYAHEANRIVIRHGGGPALEMDANHDGYLTRAEAAAGADRMFAELDSNHDGRLTAADHPREDEADVDFDGPEGLPAVDESNCTRTVEPAQGGRGQRVTVICNGNDDAQGGERRVIIRHGDHVAPHAESGRRVERDVTIIRRTDDDDGIAPPAPPAMPGAPHPAMAPLPPRPPRPPMFMMLMASSDEMDTNHDGAISRDEFRAQQLRFFDASDANGDGRIRFEPPPEPPAPPTPPAAPEAPTPPPPPR